MKKMLSIILLCALVSVFSGVAAPDPVTDVGITKVVKNDYIKNEANKTAEAIQVIYNYAAGETVAINIVKESREFNLVETVYATNILEYVETGPVRLGCSTIYKNDFVKEDVYLFGCSIRQCLYGTESLSNRQDITSTKAC